MPPKSKKKQKVEYTGWPILTSPSLRRLAQGLGVVGLVAALTFGIEKGRHVLRHAVAPNESLTLQVNPSPEWITRNLVVDLNADCAGLLSRGGTRASEIARTLEANPWVRDARIERSRAGYRATIEYREPVLAADFRGKCCYLDREAVPLDPARLSARAGADCLTLDGVQASAEPKVGKRLDDATVAGAARLAGLLARLRGPLELDRIVVEGTGTMARYRIFSRRGGSIKWGSLGDSDGRKLAELVERTRQGDGLRNDAPVDLETPAHRTIPSRRESVFSFPEHSLDSSVN